MGRGYGVSTLPPRELVIPVRDKSDPGSRVVVPPDPSPVGLSSLMTAPRPWGPSRGWRVETHPSLTRTGTHSDTVVRGRVGNDPRVRGSRESIILGKRDIGHPLV